MQSSIAGQALQLHHTSIRALSLLLLVALLSQLFPVPGRAQETIAESNTDDADVFIEEIVVIAQRRERPLQDVPISITVFESSEIEALKLSNIAGVASYTPNLVWDQSFLGAGNFSAVFIRGIGQSASFFESSADPAVGVYLDGVYIGRAIGSVLGIHDIGQIEVLRGPQGTLFGRNTTGGAVLVTTLQAVPEPSGWGDVTTGSDNRLDARGVLNVPISDTVLTRFSASSLNQDGYGSSLQNGAEFGDINTDSARATLRWLHGDDLNVTLSYDRSRTRQDAPVLTLAFADADPMSSLTGAYNFFVAPTNSVEGFGNGVPWDDRFLTPSELTNFATGQTLTDVDSEGLTATVEWRSGDVTIKSITGYRSLESEWGSDTDMSPLTIVESTIATDQDQFSQEFTLQGATGQLAWLAGVYYFDEDASEEDSVLIIPDVAEVPTDPVFGVPNPLFGVPLGNIGPATSSSGESVAAFFHLDYGLSERLSAFAGLRYTREKKTAVDNSGLVANRQTSKSFNELSPTVGLQYFVDPNLQFYASASRGFKSGGFNTIVLIPRDDFLPFKPEGVTAYELGLKMKRERFSLAAATFLYDYEDIQFPVFNDVAPEFRNAAEAEMQGAEVELVMAPTGAISIQAGVSYLDAEYSRLDAEDLAGLVAPISIDNELPNAPEWTVNLGLRWTTDIRQLGQFTLRGDYSWRDDMYKDAINTPEVKQPAHGLLFAAAEFASNDGRWTLSLFGDNLTDERYIAAGGSNKPDFGLAYATYARPRTWGLSARYSFGQAPN
ncbi:MAG: TonB-dependent receptor [Gammaproteobacteria bacterium]|nr:TonB-dependent receptor [Gammaproteobacteria bacterium]